MKAAPSPPCSRLTPPSQIEMLAPVFGSKVQEHKSSSLVANTHHRDKMQRQRIHRRKHLRPLFEASLQRLDHMFSLPLEPPLPTKQSELELSQNVETLKGHTLQKGLGEIYEEVYLAGEDFQSWVALVEMEVNLISLF